LSNSRRILSQEELIIMEILNSFPARSS
jgi:hypothetical protein